MIDALLRGPKEALLAPVVRRTPGAVHPHALTLVGLIPGIAAAFAIAAGQEALALGLWLLNRLVDGLDGTLARLTGRQSDLGGYLDILMDFVVYAAVPIGIAANLGGTRAWVTMCALLATFYVNAISWAYLSAILERRSRAGDERGPTTVAMPGGLIEGAETVVVYALMLALPAAALGLAWGLAACVVITIGQRVAWAARTL